MQLHKLFEIQQPLSKIDTMRVKIGIHANKSALWLKLSLKRLKQVLLQTYIFLLVAPKSIVLRRFSTNLSHELLVMLEEISFCSKKLRLSSNRPVFSSFIFYTWAFPPSNFRTGQVLWILLTVEQLKAFHQPYLSFIPIPGLKGPRYGQKRQKGQSELATLVAHASKLT